jgi:hypothetical protein
MAEIVYRTEDGKIFDTESEAIYWEKVSVRISEMQEYFDVLMGKYCSYDYDVNRSVIYSMDDIANHITLNFDELKKIMED